MHLLALVTDAFGGHGGIAKFNRDLLSALCALPDVEKLTALPRLIPESPGTLPVKLDYVEAASGGKLRYAIAVVRSAFRRPAPSVILCGHINLLPLAFLARWLLRFRRVSPLRPDRGEGQGEVSNPPSALRPPIVLVIHGIDAWQPNRSRWVNRLAGRVDAVVAVSEFTRKRFWDWAKPLRAQSHILPNCVDLAHFTPGPKNQELLDRYHLRDRKVMLTVARLSAAERYKGIDEVLESFPAMVKKVPNLTYLVVGDGTDRARLESKASQLGVRDHVIFAGRISEAEKVDHYRLADAFVMPGGGEGFGIVYLEAMACGVPTVASKLDASREAVRDGQIGLLVDPRLPEEIVGGTLAALGAPKVVPAGLDYFSQANFQRRVQTIAGELLES